jgi:peroxiredoxin
VSEYDPTVLPANLPAPEDGPSGRATVAGVGPHPRRARLYAQSLGFRAAYGELTSLGARVAGLSAQTLEEQREFAERTELPYPVLSDPELRLAEALGLPTFEFEGARLYKRITLVLERGRVAQAFYPVFPPNENAAEVIRWLRDRRAATA